MQYLKRLPLDQIKIDQSFVRDITTDPSEKAIVKSIAMSEVMGMSVIAGGVDTSDQLALLRQCGCQMSGVLVQQASSARRIRGHLLDESADARASQDVILGQLTDDIACPVHNGKVTNAHGLHLPHCRD